MNPCGTAQIPNHGASGGGWGVSNSKGERSFMPADSAVLCVLCIVVALRRGNSADHCCDGASLLVDWSCGDTQMFERNHSQLYAVSEISRLRAGRGTTRTVTRSPGRPKMLRISGGASPVVPNQ